MAVPLKTRVYIPQLADQQANFEANANAPNKLIVFYKSQVMLYLPSNRSGLLQWTSTRLFLPRPLFCVFLWNFY